MNSKKIKRIREHLDVGACHLIFILSQKVYRIALCFSCAPFSLCITLAVLLIRPIKKITFVRLITERIGHFAANTELMLCSMSEDVDADSFEKQKYIFYPSVRISNRTLYKMWKRVIPIAPFATISRQVDRFLGVILGNVYVNNKYKQRFEKASGDIDHDDYLASKAPHLYFTAYERQKGEYLKKKLGISEGSKYICLLVRDSAYLRTTYPNGNWDYHNYRDCDISTYRLAAEFLASKGFYVLRMGKVVAEPFQVNHPFVIDYASSPLRSDFLDIYLAATCECMISSSSGLDAVSQIFRRNIAYFNLANYPCSYRYNKVLVTLNKHIVSSVSGKKIDSDMALPLFEEAERKGLTITDVMNREGLVFVNNSSAEILDGAIRLEVALNKCTSNDKHLEPAFF